MKKLFLILWLATVGGIFFPLLLFAQEGRSLIVESIRFEGNTKTNASVIRNYLTIEEGKPATRRQLSADEFRLQQTNFFKDVYILTLPGSEKGTARVVVQVKERRWPFLQFKSGYNELDGWYISPLGIRFDNLLGHGNIFGGDLVIGDRVTATHIGFIRPFIWGSEYDFQIEVFATQRDFVHFVEGDKFNQLVKEGGLKLGISGNSGIPKFFSLAFISQNARADSFLTRGSDKSTKYAPPPYLAMDSGENEIRRFVLAFTVDTRNYKGNPSAGWWGSASYDQSSKNLGSFANYYSTVVDLRRYQPIWKNLTGAVRLKWGKVSEDAPFYEKFYLGGPNSLRGYDDRGLTPAGYASNITQGSCRLCLE
jgi:outer membrane protein insertion porin family